MKNIKRIIALMTLITISTEAQSNNFYAGLGVGPELANFNKNSTTISPGIFNVKDNSYLAGRGVFVSAFGGYALTHQAWHLAGEANIDYSNVKHQSSNSELLNNNYSTTYFRLRRTIGVSIIPGYSLKTNTVIYARLGYALGFFNISSSDSSVSNLNKNLQGILFGLGIQQALTTNISMRVEYNQANYQSTSTTTFDTVGNIMKNTNIAPVTGKTAFSVLYNFA